MEIYEAISIRRAVPEYSDKPLDDETLKNIENVLFGTKQFKGQNAKFELVPSDAVKGSAPHYIFSYCDENDEAYANVGYVLQNVDLYIQSIGLGSRYYGIKKPKNKKDGYCIMLAFGTPKDCSPRNGSQDFKRLPVEEISSDDNEVAQAARLAPSSMNSQPWYLSFEDNKIVIKFQGRGLAKMILKKKMNKIDMGIVTRHVVTALEHQGKEIKNIMPKTSGKDFNIEISYTDA